MKELHVGIEWWFCLMVGQIKITSCALVTLAKGRMPEIKPLEDLYARPNSLCVSLGNTRKSVMGVYQLISTSIRAFLSYLVTPKREYQVIYQYQIT